MLNGWEQKQKDGKIDSCGVEEGSQKNARTQMPMEISRGDSGWPLLTLCRGLKSECYNLTFNHHSTKLFSVTLGWP